jgi:hypothetical protein
MASTNAGPSSPLTLALNSELQQATSPHHVESAAMSMGGTTSSTATVTTAGQQDIHQLDISSPHELTAFVGAHLTLLI